MCANGKKIYIKNKDKITFKIKQDCFNLLKQTNYPSQKLLNKIKKNKIKIYIQCETIFYLLFLNQILNYPFGLFFTKILSLALENDDYYHPLTQKDISDYTKTPSGSAVLANFIPTSNRLDCQVTLHMNEAAFPSRHELALRSTYHRHATGR